jgi:two-component system, NarL family, response regulator NreC
MISVLLADDHPVVRRGLRAVLEAESDLRVAGETGDGLEAVRLVEELRPHVLVLDLMMPGLPGLEVARQVSHRFPATKIVMLSMHSNEAYVLEALRNGASGYILKGAGAGELVQAVRAVSAGQRHLSAPLSDRAIADYVEKAKAAALTPLDRLSAREREVLAFAAEGQSSADIAARLGISPRTAETHRANLLQKLGLHSQTDLVRFAMRHGILPPE